MAGELRNAGFAALLLGAFAVGGTAAVALTHALTRERIAANERAALERALHAVMPPERHDNDPLSDYVRVTDPMLLGTTEPVTVYRARRGGRPVGVILTPVAPDGYNGRIRLIVGIYADWRTRPSSAGACAATAASSTSSRAPPSPRGRWSRPCATP